MEKRSWPGTSAVQARQQAQAQAQAQAQLRFPSAADPFGPDTPLASLLGVRACVRRNLVAGSVCLLRARGRCTSMRVGMALPALHVGTCFASRLHAHQHHTALGTLHPDHSLIDVPSHPPCAGAALL